jgi:Tfp pilus assembly protein PilF
LTDTERRPRWHRAAAVAVGLLIFALAGGACAARRAPSPLPASGSPSAPIAKAEAPAPLSPPDTSATRTIETTDARLAAAVAALKSGPTSASLKAVAAEYMRLGVLDQAIDSLTRALAMAPADATLFAMRARAYRDWDQPDTGLGDAHRATYLAPRSADAFNTLGTIQFALNQTSEARASFERALELVPGAAFPLSNLCYLALIQGDEATALSRCSAALERDPASTLARNNLALVHASAGRLDEARKLFLESADKAAGYYNMGIVLMSRRDYSAAALSFSDACRLKPSFDAACRRAIEARGLASRNPSRHPL